MSGIYPCGCTPTGKIIRSRRVGWGVDAAGSWMELAASEPYHGLVIASSSDVDSAVAYCRSLPGGDSLGHVFSVERPLVAHMADRVIVRPHRTTGFGSSYFTSNTDGQFTLDVLASAYYPPDNPLARAPRIYGVGGTATASRAIGATWPTMGGKRFSFTLNNTHATLSLKWQLVSVAYNANPTAPQNNSIFVETPIDPITDLTTYNTLNAVTTVQYQLSLDMTDFLRLYVINGSGAATFFASAVVD